MANLGSRSIFCPPYFNGSNYSVWINLFEIFICAKDVDLWKIIIREYVFPIDKNGV